MRIYGAGFAGLLAGTIFQNAELFEAGPAEQAQHRAILRFRSSAVGDAVGIEFKPVRVRKAIYFANEFVEPDIRLANWYAAKVVGRYEDRSIWSVGTVDRWVAPETLLEQLAERCGNRVYWNTRIKAGQLDSTQPTISTLPMSLMAKFVGYDHDAIPEFNSRPVYIYRFRVKNCNLHQTIYFPAPTTHLYRASIVGDLLICECTTAEALPYSDILTAFGFHAHDIAHIDTTEQKYGKISPIDPVWRKQFMFELTQRYNIFSLGRFGTWRNILLDDVLKDIAVIRRLMNSPSYERAKLVGVV
jgi:hypothetical protein